MEKWQFANAWGTRQVSKQSIEKDAFSHTNMNLFITRTSYITISNQYLKPTLIKTGR
jgi:hypothetical protein